MLYCYIILFVLFYYVMTPAL